MKKGYLLTIIALFVIGFAAVATNIFINGTINFGFNNEDFNDGVVFTYKDTYNGEANISEDKKTINFTSEKIENVNQQAILTYDVANKSQQYDASVTISCNFEEGYGDFSEWLKIEQDLTSPFELKAGATITGHLTVTLIKAYNESLTKDVNMICTIIATPKERDTEGTYIPKEHEYEEVLLKGADPVLEATPVEEIALAAETNEKKLIPVKIDENGKVTRADTTKEWYNYEKKEWANAVILNDGIVDPGPEEEIKEEQIESYFVWIPKYRYKLWNVGVENPVHTGPFPIEIEFGTEDTTDNETECVAPNKSGETGKCANGKWMTHPAFTSFDVNGFWVGKFEVGYKDATSKTDAKDDIQDSTKIIVKPDSYTWRKMSNENMFNSLKGYATNLDSHMMKNTEWGAVAYLSHSKYGLNNQVAQNTYLEYKTGYAKTDDGIAEYNSSEGVKASTTGNITGVYDMSGGAWERLAAYRDVENENDAVGQSGFIKQEILSIDAKYFDVYNKDSTNTSYENRILGDATGEMGPIAEYRSSWRQDCAYFVENERNWFVRGDRNTDSSDVAGQFYFGRSYGSAVDTIGSRLVLSPKE